MKAKILRKIREDSDDEDIRENLSQFLASRSVLLSAVTFAGAGGLLLSEPEKGSLLMALQPYAPAVLSLSGSFLSGLFVGRAARRRLAPVFLTGGVAIAAIGLMTKYGVIGPAADQWVQSSVGWVSGNMDKAQGYIATLLPSTTAAGSGLYLGFRRKKKPRENR